MDQKTNQLYDYLIDFEIVTEQEMALVTSINGTNLDTMESILYARTGWRSYDQAVEFDG
tara:strand:+ start:14500 stop:14676 length:177 start_codon:yes stop_codon:yes gene_type:complete